MQALQIKLEVVTPLFLSGAEPQGEPELRPASFRGALRFWWRAVVGGLIGDDPKRLQENESSIFGSPEKGSSVVVRVRELQSAKSVKQFYRQGKGTQSISSGHDYLLWSMKGFRGESDRRGFYPGPSARFELVLQARPGATNSERAWQEVCAALWLFTQLGSLGSRARRAAGSLGVIAPAPQVSDLPTFQVPRSAKELRNHLQTGIKQVRELLGQRYPDIANFVHPPGFDVLHPQACRIWVLADESPWITWVEAVEGLGAKMRDFRNRTAPDHDGVLDWLTKNRAPDKVERAVFGLPLPFRYTHPRVQGVVEGTNHDRRASPLWLRVAKLDSKSYVGIATLFKSEFLPDGERLQVKGKHGQVPAPSDCTLLEDFISTQFPRSWEVQL